MNQNIERQARIWAMLCHLSANIWFLLYLIIGGFFNIPVYVPFINILLTLFIWKRQKSRYAWVDTNGKESLNFQISMTIYIVIYIIIIILLAPTCGIELSQILAVNTIERRKANYYLGMALMLMVVLLFYQTVCSISAAIQAYRGKIYRYSSTIRFLN